MLATLGGHSTTSGVWWDMARLGLPCHAAEHSLHRAVCKACRLFRLSWG